MVLLLALLIGAFVYIKIKQELSNKRRALVRYEGKPSIEQIKKELAEKATGRKLNWVEVEEYWKNNG